VPVYKIISILLYNLLAAFIKLSKETPFSPDSLKTPLILGSF